MRSYWKLVSGITGIAMIVATPMWSAALRSHSQVPVFFFANSFDARSPVKFLARTPGLSVSFKQQETVLDFKSSAVTVEYQGSNPDAVIEGASPLTARANFLVGAESSNWRTGIPLYGQVRYSNLYPGIDMVYGGTDRALKSEFIVHPGAKASAIRMSYGGAGTPVLGADGSLQLSTPAGTMTDAAPDIYQMVAGQRRKIRGAYRIRDDNTVEFAIGDYDRNRVLVIDPVVNYSTYFGGSGFDAASGLAVDASGNAYIAGCTDSADLPIAAPMYGTSGGSVDAFVVKLNPAGNSLIYATYLGGSRDDRAFSIAVDSSGNAVIAGWTSSTDFPVRAAAQAVLSGGRDAFVAKLNASGSGLVFSTFLGGSGSEAAYGVALDSAGNVYVTGDTTSTNFPASSGAARTISGGRQDAFAASYSSVGSLNYATYLGGNGDDHGSAIAVDGTGAAYITGNTTSPNFPIVGGFQTGNGGGQDAFVTKLGANGASLLYSSYLGGSGGVFGSPESGNAIVVDNSGNAYIAGVTSSSNFPTASPFQASIGGGGLDAFVSKVNAAGSALIYSSYLGGLGVDVANGIAVDSLGNAYVAGYTSSSNFPSALPIQSAPGGGYDAFVAQISPSGSSLLFASYFGGNASDVANAIALNGTQSVWIAGQTTSTNFPVKNAYRNYGYSDGNAFVARIDMPGTLAQMTTPVPGSTFAAASQTFSWTSAAGADNYWLDVGNSVGHGDISAGATTVTSKAVSGLPCDGRRLYVRLWTHNGGNWQIPFDYTYTAASGGCGTATAQMISPVPQTTLTTSPTFSWTTSSGADNYWLDVGNSIGHGDISGGATTATSKTVSGLPSDGRTIYVRLWTHRAGAWQTPFDYTYTAPALAQMASPVPATTFSGKSVTFSWTSVTGADNYWLDVGNSGGVGDLSAGATTSTSKTASGLPCDGRRIYVRLWTHISGAWQTPSDYIYTATTNCTGPY